MSMHTPQEWHRQTGANMGQAQNTQGRAVKQNVTSVRTHHETHGEHLGRYGNLTGALEQKVQDSSRLVDGLQRRAESLENSIQKTQHSLAMLHAAHQAKDPQIQLCLWRLSRRERRPLREQKRDPTEILLEQEKETLKETQKRLGEAMRRTESVIRDLEDKLQEVRHDIDHKLQALGIDQTCLRTTQRSHGTYHEAGRPNSVPPGGGSTAVTGNIPSHRGVNARLAPADTHRNEMKRHQDTVKLGHSGGAKEERAKALRDDNSKLISSTQKAADDAAAKTERGLQDSINENQHLRRRLENEIGETRAKIDHTKDTMAETRAQIRALEEPTDNAATCASFRRQRATREHIHDPVSTRIQEHQMSTHRAHQELLAHHAEEKANLQDLNERMERLKDDLRDKTAALHIDGDCITHQAGHHTLNMPFNHPAATAGTLRGRRHDHTYNMNRSNFQHIGKSDLRHVAGSTFPVLPHTAR
mmetsp:Transcript_81830/g.162447  ORF Transcript_81830/g.162447 Transcript_81830/m.162447 type:complete len:473 (-) Transcript_81830:26-1444(-)